MSKTTLVTLTPKAVSKVKEFLTVEGKQNAGLRLYVAGGGCAGLSYGMVIEENPSEEDIVMEEQGVKVFVDPMSAQHLKGANVDYVESLMGSGFKIENPNVVSSCACGHSFTTG
ncbi:MAG: iron-sulfur cluster insertion protein ErpA [Thaumarchaeota archaeon]|nr:iron-sulfur cluster insertion protein ErpA [Nitrososphaerota archaeon]